jgi:membrane protease YdiL (CAAX protease family)
MLVFAGPVLALLIAVLGLALQTPEINMPIRDLLTDWTSVLLVGIFATTLGPLCEELAFRGFLLPLVARSLGRVAGVIVAALPFAILHGPQYAWSWRHVLLITLAGAVFGWVRLRSRSTFAAALVHAGYNLTFFSAYLFQGKDLPVRW